MDNETFTISEAKGKGYFEGVLEGKYIIAGDTIIMKDDTPNYYLPNYPFEMKLINRTLHGFPLDTMPIQLKRTQ